MSAQITIIAGPTASGKSAEAVRRAKAAGGIVLNADALQLYEELRILSARPVEAEMEGVSHQLFGVLTHETQASAGKWLALAKAEIDAALASGTPVVVVGGTGLYLEALLEGLSPIPEVPAEVVDKVKELAVSLRAKRASGRLAAAPHGAEACAAIEREQNIGSPRPCRPRDDGSLHTLLTERDPLMAAQLKPGDTQRIMRALAVLEHTGQSLAHWQAQPKEPLYPRELFRVIRLELPRETLYARCDARFDAMLEAGALDEVKQLQSLDIAADHTLTKAVGVPELLGYLEGKWSLEEAVEKARQHTRNYAKRQLTWLRHQLQADEVYPT